MPEVTPEPIISSAANPLIKRIRLLAERKHRRREGAFVVEGIQPVWQAVEAGADIEVLVVAPDLLKPPAARAMITTEEERGTRVARVTSELFTRIAQGRKWPGGLAAIVAARPVPLAALDVPAGALFVALHEPGNPGNVGTIIRTASAVGAAGVILTGAATDPYDPVAVKASMGALFDVPVAAASAEGFLDWSASRHITVAAASARGERSVWEAEFPAPLALLLGSEGEGLPGPLLDRAGLHVRIPMVGTAESLNLAVAAGVLLYEVRRRTGLTQPAL